MKISSESREFLKNLRIYLFSSGKYEKEIEEIVGELGDHLFEAEQNGKNVEDIIGKTPKEYMEQIANEMPIDIKGLLKYIPIIVIGAFSYILMGDAIRGELEYSLIDMIGYPFIFLFSLLLISVLFKYVASNKISKIKDWKFYCNCCFNSSFRWNSDLEQNLDIYYSPDNFIFARIYYK